MNWHLQAIEASLEEFQTRSETGLSQAEADARLTLHGSNELVETGGRTPLKIFWEQITATMVLILIAAAVVAGLLGDTKNTIAIGDQVAGAQTHLLAELYIFVKNIFRGRNNLVF
mgnify:CR=1 FL=1